LFNVLLDDGNLVLYERKEDKKGKYRVAIWASVTFSLVRRYAGPYTCVLEDSGRLVLYNRVREIMWVSEKKVKKDRRGPFTCVVQDTGKIVILDADSNCVWSCEHSVIINAFAPRIEGH
jgi:hypothetical protein